MAIKIQYELRWNGVPAQFQDVGTFEVPKGGTDINVPLPDFGQSDRRVPSSLGFACYKYMVCNLHIHATRRDDNSVSFENMSMDNFVFHYALEPGVPVGSAVVPGKYQFWFSPDNGTMNDVYTSSAPSTAQPSYEEHVSYTQTFQTINNIKAQTNSDPVVYGRCYNHNNANDLYVYLRFFNDYPADYRPGAIYDGANWVSHNRANGRADIYDGSSWKTMRTIGAPTEKGDAPEIYRDGDWYNMRKIGQE